MKDMDRIEVLFEDMQDGFDGVVEGMAVMQSDISEMKPQLARIPFIEADIATIKTVIREHSTELKTHDRDITALSHRIERPERKPV